MQSSNPKLMALVSGANSIAWRSDMLGNKHFTLAIAGAVTLHLLAIGVWHLVPRSTVLDIPVRALNIKLGDDEILTSEDIAAAAPDGANNSAVEDMITTTMAQKARSDIAVSSIDKAMKDIKAVSASEKNKKAEPEPPVPQAAAKQFVRNAPVPASNGIKDGNSKSPSAELISRYEQLISLWVQKFKIYPDEARDAGMEGETVVRVRIDRRGTIRYYALERSTGHGELDRAAIAMIRRANPVPAVPNDYPEGDLLEFLIPVNFRLH